MPAVHATSRLALVVSAALLAFCLPFELKTPWLALGPFVVTNVELLLYITLAAGAAVWVTGPRTWSPVHTAAVLWAGALIASAVFAEEPRALAAKFTLRSLTGIALLFAVSLVPVRSAVTLLGAAAAGAVVAAAAAIAEAWVPGAVDALMPFKTQPSRAAGFLRASGTFQYANTASMYLEAVLPLIVVIGGLAVTRARHRALSTVASLAVVAAIVLTASRGGLLVSAVLLVAALVLARVRGLSGMQRPAAVALGGLLFFVATPATDRVAALRLTAEDEAEWYRVSYDTPVRTLRLHADEDREVMVRIENHGLATWPSAGEDAIFLSYHLLDPVTGEIVMLNGLRSPLRADVGPGDAITVKARVRAPTEGQFTLRWDLVQENVMWFSSLRPPIRSADIALDVSADSRASRSLPPSPALGTHSKPARLALWSAGLAMWRERPILGVGPDNFRHRYGPYLRQERFDDRIHANNLYVEVLATVGLVGAVAFALLLVSTTGALLAAWRSADPIVQRLAVAVGLALSAFLVHGAVDYFLEFTPTYGLFWMLIGLAVGIARPRPNG